MRSYPLSVILLLCAVIILVDSFAFYWLYTITQAIGSSLFKNSLYILFWLFTLGLISAIIFLKIRINLVELKRRQLYISYLYGLTVSSLIPKLIFTLVISTLYFTNSILFESKSEILIPIGGVLAGFLPFFIILHGIFRTLYRFGINRLSIEFEDLPHAFDGKKIVHISDLHLGSFNFQYHILERAVKLINGLEADFIFFTGDLVNNYAWELKGWEKVLAKLKAKHGIFAVLGNHDYGDYSIWIQTI